MVGPPFEQRFLSGKYSRIYEVMHMACQSVCFTNIPTTRLTRCMNDFTNAKSHARKKPLPSGEVGLKTGQCFLCGTAISTTSFLFLFPVLGNSLHFEGRRGSSSMWVSAYCKEKGVQPVFILTFSYYMVGHED